MRRAPIRAHFDARSLTWGIHLVSFSNRRLLVINSLLPPPFPQPSNQRHLADWKIQARAGRWKDGKISTSELIIFFLSLSLSLSLSHEGKYPARRVQNARLRQRKRRQLSIHQRWKIAQTSGEKQLSIGDIIYSSIYIFYYHIVMILIFCQCVSSLYRHPIVNLSKERGGRRRCDVWMWLLAHLIGRWRGDVTGDTMARCPGGLPPEGRRPRRCPPFHSTKEGKIATRSRFSFVIDWFCCILWNRRLIWIDALNNGRRLIVKYKCKLINWWGNGGPSIEIDRGSFIGFDSGRLPAGLDRGGGIGVGSGCVN